MLLGFLLVRQLRLLLYLDNQREVELLVGEHDLNLHQVLQELARQLLHLHESNQEEYVRFQCSYAQVVALREGITPKLSLLVA